MLDIYLEQGSDVDPAKGFSRGNQFLQKIIVVYPDHMHLCK